MLLVCNVILAKVFNKRIKTMTNALATFGGGCFWCLEAIFSEVKGVLHVKSGFAGSDEPHPTYEQVCHGLTNHAEVVHVTFDPEVMSYQALVKIFFAIHDPTTLNRQGNDVGTQYRSIILFHDEVQQRIALEVIEEIQPAFASPIVTQVVPYDIFYEAEAYHQNYFKNNPRQGYCTFVIRPKVEHFKEMYTEVVKEEV